MSKITVELDVGKIPLDLHISLAKLARGVFWAMLEYVMSGRVDIVTEFLKGAQKAQNDRLHGGN